MIELLDLLGSQTRRKILRMLSDEPSYLSEISKILGVGHKALISHLSALENFGILKSYEKESVKAPSRKYYEISKDTCLWVKISSKGYQKEIFDPKYKYENGEFQSFSQVPEKINQINTEIQKLDSYTDPVEKFSAMNMIIKSLTGLKKSLMSTLYFAEDNISALQQNIEEILKEQFNPDEAAVLSSIAMQLNSLDDIAEHTRMNPYHIMYVLNDFETRGIVQKKGDRWLFSEKYLKEPKMVEDVE